MFEMDGYLVLQIIETLNKDESPIEVFALVKKSIVSLQVLVPLHEL